MKIIMFAGSSKCGKTTLANATTDHITKYTPFSAEAWLNPLRKDYIRNGISNENEALEQKVDLQIELQKKLFDSAMSSMTAAALTSEEDVLVCDRSPYDYMAYQAMLFQAVMVEEQFKYLRLQAAAKLHALMALSVDGREVVDGIDIWFTPYPAIFQSDGAGSDHSFTHASRVGNRITWSAYVSDMLSWGQRQMIGNIRVFTLRDYPQGESTDAKSLALYVAAKSLDIREPESQPTSDQQEIA